MISGQTKQPTIMPRYQVTIYFAAICLSRISGMEWWNGTLEWNTGMALIVFKTSLSH